MWDFIAKIFPTLFDVATRSKKNTDDIKGLATRADITAQALARLDARLERLESNQERTEERHRAEMRELLLRLENILLRHGINPNFPENQLPEAPRNDA